MPLNLLKKYNDMLDIRSLSAHDATRSLRAVFDRDFVEKGQPFFNGKPIHPTTIDGMDPMDILFTHLTTSMTDKSTRHREFEAERSMRLHWVRFHLDCCKHDNMIVFSAEEKDGIRTYIYDRDEKYVIVLCPRRDNDYYLLTAYHITGRDAQRDKIMSKYRRRLHDIV